MISVWIAGTYVNSSTYLVITGGGLYGGFLIDEKSGFLFLLFSIGSASWEPKMRFLQKFSWWVTCLALKDDGTSGKPWTSRGMWWTPGWKIGLLEYCLGDIFNISIGTNWKLTFDLFVRKLLWSISNFMKSSPNGFVRYLLSSLKKLSKPGTWPCNSHEFFAN